MQFTENDVQAARDELHHFIQYWQFKLAILEIRINLVEITIKVLTNLHKLRVLKYDYLKNQIILNSTK